MREEAFNSARILIVDDTPANIDLLRRILGSAGFQNVRSTTNPREVVPIFAREDLDLILLDLHMPEMDGFQVLEELTPWIPEGSYLPILVLTGDLSTEVKERALASGAKDFLTKPVASTEVLLRISNLLETRHLHRRLQEQNQELEQRVQDRTRELEEARVEALERLARAAEYRDDETGEHTRRVGILSGKVSRAMGCPAKQVDLILKAAPLHDLGKIGIPDGILLKPGKLSVKEYEVMRAHTLIGANILSGSKVPLLQLAATIALTHHERWDGHGYPEGLAGTDIPLVGRIVSVVDVWDALTHERPYKQAWPVEAALQELDHQRGRQFDSEIVTAFFQVLEQEPALRNLNL